MCKLKLCAYIVHPIRRNSTKGEAKQNESGDGAHLAKHSGDIDIVIRNSSNHKSNLPAHIKK